MNLDMVQLAGRRQRLVTYDLQPIA